MRRLWPLRFLALVFCSFFCALLLAHPLPGLAQHSAREAFEAGQVRYEAGEYAEALVLIQQAVAGFEQDDSEQSNSKLQRAIALGNLSLIHQQLDQWPEAAAAIRESLDFFDKPALQKTEPLLLAAALEIQASLQLSTGQVEAALATWERSEALYEAETDLRGQLNSRINQAQALRMLGFFGRARSRLEALAQQVEATTETWRLGERGDDERQLRVSLLHLLGDALRLSGDVEQSQRTLNQSLELAAQLESVPQRRRQQASLLLSLASTARLENQSAAALDYYDRAIALQPDESLQIQAVIGKLSLYLAAPQQSQSRLESATVELLDELMPRLSDLSRDQTGLYSRLYLAQTLLSTPDRSSQRLLDRYRSELETLLQESVQLATTLGDRRSMAYAQGTLGSFYEQTGAVERAIALTESAVRLAQSINATDISYRWNWQLGRLLSRRDQITDAIGFYDNAIDDLNQLRSDLVAVNREVQFSFKESVEPVYRESVGLLLQTRPELSPAQTADNLEKARERIEALQVAELDNFFREACLDGRSVVLDQVVDRDNPTTSIIYPILLEDRLEVVVKIPGQPELQRHTALQPRATVEETLRALRVDLQSPARTRVVRQQAATLYGWLVEPFETALAASDVDTLVFVLDGALRNVPMGVLYDGEQYLIEKYGVGVSLGLQLLEPKAIAQTNLNVLAAGLVTPPEDYRRRYADLPFIETEFQNIRESGVSNRQLLNQEFTRERLESEVRQDSFNVVHLATHGEFSSDAERTFILAADGPIKVAELDTLLRDRSQTSEAAIELLILSACETAEGDERAALGLAGVAVKAGARSTLASLWHADDESTAVLMGSFYEQLMNRDLTKAQALRQAQLALLADRDLKAPAYWAPYILVGNWL